MVREVLVRTRAVEVRVRRGVRGKFVIVGVFVHVRLLTSLDRRGTDPRHVPDHRARAYAAGTGRKDRQDVQGRQDMPERPLQAAVGQERSQVRDRARHGARGELR